jgi:hypothetical protein
MQSLLPQLLLVVVVVVVVSSPELVGAARVPTRRFGRTKIDMPVRPAV